MMMMVNLPSCGKRYPVCLVVTSQVANVLHFRLPMALLSNFSRKVADIRAATDGVLPPTTCNSCHCNDGSLPASH